MMKFFVCAFLLTLSALSLACSEDGKNGFLPANNMRIPVGNKSINGITEAKFNAVINLVERIMTPIVSQNGGSLVINRLWKNAEVNAYASRPSRTWQVDMFGGLARHPAVTEDGYILALCHEIGHHIGGAPKYSGGDWAGVEGQADYYASLKCMRFVLQDQNNAAAVKRLNPPATVTAACAKSYSRANDRNICIRAAMAGSSIANLFSSLRNEAKNADFTTPDSTVVRKTFEDHPETQCRLDTYFAGAVCNKDHREDVSQTEEVKGTCHASLGDKIGLRPGCWFKGQN